MKAVQFVQELKSDRTNAKVQVIDEKDRIVSALPSGEVDSQVSSVVFQRRANELF